MFVQIQFSFCDKIQKTHHANTGCGRHGLTAYLCKKGLTMWLLKASALSSGIIRKIVMRKKEVTMPLCSVLVKPESRLLRSKGERE